MHVLLSVFANQPEKVVKSLLEDWRSVCDRDGLYESRLAFEDLNRSFKNGTPCDMEEFFDNNNVRKEWIQWIYNKL